MLLIVLNVRLGRTPDFQDPPPEKVFSPPFLRRPMTPSPFFPPQKSIPGFGRGGSPVRYVQHAPSRPFRSHHFRTSSNQAFFPPKKTTFCWCPQPVPGHWPTSILPDGSVSGTLRRTRFSLLATEIFRGKNLANDLQSFFR